MTTSLWLVATKRMPEKLYWLPILLSSLCLVYSFTLMGIHVVGSDVSTEHYASYTILQEGYWDITRHYETPATIINGWLVPELSKLLHIEVVWIYKAVLPIFLAASPLIIFFAYNKFLSADKSFYATSLFIITPPFMLELVAIGKTMVAVFFFSLFLLSMFSSMSTFKKTVAMSICTISAAISHYTVGAIIIIFLVAILTFRIASHLLDKLAKVHWKLNWKTSMLSMVVTCLVLVAAFVGFYSINNEGRITTKVVQIVHNNLPIDENLDTEEAKAQLEPATQLALGMDFFQASVLEKIFRLLQLAVQALIIIGFAYLAYPIIRYKENSNIPTEVIVCAGAILVMFAACIMIPKLSRTMNITRLYQYGLVFLSPMFVTGIEKVTTSLRGSLVEKFH